MICNYRLLLISQSESESEVTQSCPTLCDPMDCSLPGSSVHGIFQATILEWVAISFSRGSSPSRDWNQVSRIVGRCFTVWATREVLIIKIKKAYWYHFRLTKKLEATENSQILYSDSTTVPILPLSLHRLFPLHTRTYFLNHFQVSCRPRLSLVLKIQT